MLGWQVFFFLLGTISSISQTILLREFATWFYGNEIIYSLGLGLWLLLAGLGSLSAQKITFFKKSQHLWLIIFSLILLLPVSILALRFVTPKFILRGELPLFPLTLLSFFIALFLFAFPLGACFPLAVRTFQKHFQISVNQGYFWEALGLLNGGLIFSFWLCQTTFPLTPSINFLSLSWQFPQIVNSINTKYQRIVVTKTNDQLNYFLNGQLAFTSNENSENQSFFHLVSPYIGNSRKILLFINPSLANFLQNKFSDAEIKLLETDQKYWQMWKQLLDPKIKILILDPRKFLKENQEKFDLIICSPGNPQTLLANRLFTKESFDLFKKNLNNNGVFVLAFSLPTDYQGEEAISFGASIYQTFKTIFPESELLLKDEQIFLLGGESLATDANFKSDFFLSQFQSSQREKIIANWSLKNESINTDLEPVAFFRYQLFWQKILDFKLPSSLLILTKIVPFFFISILFLLIKKRGKLPLQLLMLISSFVLISLETIIIFMFQTKIGYLFSQISLIFAFFLIGVAIGVKVARIPLITLRRSLFVLLISILAFFRLMTSVFAEVELFWLVAALIFGTVGGINFALINNLYFDKDKKPSFIYAFDLVGSSFGAFFSSTILLPFYGLKQFLLGIIVIILICLTAKLQK